MEGEEREEDTSTRLMTIDEVARELNVGRTFAWVLTAEGHLPTVRLGRLIRVRPADLRAYVDQLARGGERATDGPSRVAGGQGSGRYRR